MRLNKITLILLIFIFLALAMRLLPIDYGLPMRLFSDEYIQLANALKMLEQKTLFLSFSYLPPLTSYLLMFLIIIYGALGMVFGIFDGLADFRELVLLNSEQLLILVRVMTVAFGLAAVWLTFKLGRRLFAADVGLMAALFLVFDFLHLHASVSGRFWIPLGVFILLAVISLFQLSKTGQSKYYYLSAVFIGLGFGTGLLSILLVPWLILAHIYALKPKSFKAFLNKRLIVSLLITFLLMAFFSLGNTYAVFRQFGQALAVILSNLGYKINYIEVNNLHNQSDIIGNLKTITSSLIYDLKFFIPFIFIGFYFAFFKRLFNWFEKSLLIGFPILYYLSLILFFSKAFHRFNVPLIPFFLIFAAYGVVYLVNRFFPLKKYLLIVITSFLLLMPSFLTDVVFLSKYLAPDTRVQARNWILDNLPSNSRLIVDDDDLIFSLIKDKASINFLKQNNEFWVNTKDDYLLALAESEYPKPNYFIYDWRHLDLDKLNLNEVIADYYLVSFWQRDYLKIGNKWQRYQKLDKFDKQLIAKFYPSNSLEAVNDIPNSPREVDLTLDNISSYGPFVEIYKLN